MRRASVVRCAGVMVALLSISLISFPSFPSTIGFSPNPQTVNRELKGDRQRTTAPPPGYRRFRGRTKRSPLAAIRLLARSLRRSRLIAVINVAGRHCGLPF